MDAPKRPYKIALDLDDVLSLSAKGYTDFSNRTWGTTLNAETYNEHWDEMWNISAAETDIRNNIIWKSEATGDFEVVPGSQEGISELKKLGAELLVITSRPLVGEEVTTKWLNRNFQGMFNGIHFAGMYDNGMSLAAKTGDKLDSLTKLGADALVDDLPKHCWPAADMGLDVVLFGDYRWTRNVAEHDNITKISSWPALVEHFAKILVER